MKKISIVLPVYNGEKYISESIQSIINQTYSNWELWIVNDCSTDNTEQIISEYEKKDSRIKIIYNKENQKLPKSLNIGFKYATGDYFTWTSDDNYYKEDALEKMVQVLEQYPEYGMVYCDYSEIDENGSIGKEISVDCDKLFCYNCIGACFLYRKEIASLVGEYAPEMFLVEDYDYWLRIRKISKIFHLQQNEYFYRKHGGSLTEQKAKQIDIQLYKLRRRELDFLLKNINEEEKEALILDMLSVNREDVYRLKEKLLNDEKLPKYLQTMIEGKMMKIDNSKPIALFGAGDYGKKALDFFGREKVAVFVDNNKTIVGTTKDGIPIIHFMDLVQQQINYQIVISVDARKAGILAKQLEDVGIKEYRLYIDILRESRQKVGETSIDFLKVFKKAESWIYNNSIIGEGIINNTEVRYSYPEVTGYFIPSLLRFGYRDLALNYAQWLCSIQKEDGSWYDTYNNAPYVFDSAQILKGLLAIRDIYPKVEEHIIRGCDWILTNIQENGRLTTPNYSQWGTNGECSELIHLYCLEPLYMAAKIYKISKYSEEADRVKKYYIDNHKEDILNFSFLSHFYAYVMEALCDIGEIELVKEAMEKISLLQKEDGMVPAYYNVNWVCSTGLFQLAIVWYKLGEIEKGNKAFSYACSLQNPSGGWFGSYMTKEDAKPTEQESYPTYMAESEISWAVKYFLDALYFKCKVEFDVKADEFSEYIDKKDGRYQVVLKEIQMLDKKANVCDIGCGKGRYLLNLLEDVLNINLFCVDLSEQVMNHIPSSIEKRQGSLTNIPYEDNSFDMVYTVEALEHAIAIENAVTELVRITKPGGTILILDKNKSAQGLLEIEDWEQWFDDTFFETMAKKLNCSLKIQKNISYENSITDGLFSAWVLGKKKEN